MTTQNEATETKAAANVDASALNSLLCANKVDESTDFKPLIKRLELADGESVSVQTGRTHYCSPRDNHGPWYTVEVGYPSVDPGEKWKEYFDGDWDTQDHTDSVYGYVPINMVVDFINEHGGLSA
jgi:hypothetical protein